MKRYLTRSNLLAGPDPLGDVDERQLDLGEADRELWEMGGEDLVRRVAPQLSGGVVVGDPHLAAHEVGEREVRDRAWIVRRFVEGLAKPSGGALAVVEREVAMADVGFDAEAYGTAGLGRELLLQI